MVVFTGTAVVYVVWQGAVRVVSSKLAKELIKTGAKYLTKKNFKKTYDFFKGNKKLKTSEKNKILEDLNIVTPKVKKVSKVPKLPKKEVKKPEVKKPEKVFRSSVPGIRPGESLTAYFTRMAKETKAPKKPEIKKPEVPKKEIKKPEAPKKEVKPPEKLHAQVKEHLQSGGSADKGAKIVEGVTKPSLKSQMREILLPGFKKRSFIQYPAYYAAGSYVKGRHDKLMSDEAADALEIVKQKNLDEEKKLKKKSHETKIKETTLGEIDINTIVDQEHKWKMDNSGNYVVE